MSMCGRFALSAMLTDIQEEFSTTGQPNRTLPFDWNIKPTQDIYIVKANAERTIEVVSWGLIAPWSKTTDGAYRSQSQAINARWETVHEKPTFKSALISRRCLIPASGYYEWATELGEFPSKQPFFITSETNPILAFSGIYSTWTSPEGVIRKSAALITRDAVGNLAKIHNRMPLFLPKERWSAWLDPQMNSVHEIRDLMTLDERLLAGITGKLAARPVRNLVNSIKNNGPELIEPMELGEPETLF